MQPLLSGIDPNVWLYATCFLGPLCAIFAILWLYNRREGRRRRAIALANEFGAWGLTKLAHALSCYAIGDYSGFVEAVHALLERIRADGLPEVFRDLFEKLLTHFVKEEAWREKITKAVAAAKITSGTGSTTAATGTQAAQNHGSAS